MTHINWLFIGILVYLCSLCSSKNSDNNALGEDVAGTGWQYRYHSMSMYTMVVSKGCTYLAGFIQSMYVRSAHDRNSKIHEDCDWQTWVRTKCTYYHIPSEVCTGLISCGTACSLSTLRAPQDMMNSCNVSTPKGGGHSGKRAFSFRYHYDYNTLNLCSTTTSHHSYSIFGRRSVATNHSTSNSGSSHPMGNGGTPHSTGNSGSSHRTNHGNGVVSKGSMKRWCKVFSRYIRTRFHFNEVKFVHSSPYWLVDVYKIGPKFGVPLMHTHGLVGCGMEYALSALNAPSWLSKFYRSPN